MSNQINKYSASELAEFEAHIQSKLAQSEKELEFYDTQLEAVNESKNSEGDWMDDSANNSDFEMISALMQRQRKHVQDLKNALIRIKNGVYGVCVVTGQLIDKKRLMAVPTTTKSVAAKMDGIRPLEKKSAPKESVPPRKVKRITKQDLPVVKDDDFFDDEEELDINEWLEDDGLLKE